MKTSIRLLCWILVGALFCAVSLGGCGGSDNLASVNVQDDQLPETPAGAETALTT